MRSFFLLLIFALHAPSTYGQKTKTFEGKISYSVSIQGDGPEVSMARNVMPSRVIYVLKNGSFLVEQQGGMAAVGGIFIYNQVIDKAFIKNDSYKTVTIIHQEVETGVVPVLKRTDKTKVIAGYPCVAFSFQFDDGASGKGEIWVAESLKVKYKPNFNANTPLDNRLLAVLPGFPLAMTFYLDNFQMDLVADAVHEKRIEDGVFELPGDYKVIDLTDVDSKQIKE
jgi:hypothetical protein